MMFDKRLSILRKKNNFNREELGKKLGVSYSTIAKYESGSREPDMSMLNKISALFDVTIDYLTGRTDKPTATEHDEKTAIMNKIANDFPDADLMFHDLAGMSAEDLQEVYEFIKFKVSQKDK